MTMAFLPATFLATVFAIPNVADDRSHGFGTLLAISISTATAILLVLAAITQRRAIRKLFRVREVRNPLGSLTSSDTTIEEPDGAPVST